MTTALNSGRSARTTFDTDADTWLAILRASGRSPRTLTLYGHIIRPLAEWFERPLAEMTRADAALWVSYARERWTDGGVVTRLKCIRALFNWMVEEGIIPATPWRGLNVRVEEKPMPTATDAQVEAMLAGADAQERALLLVLCDTGMRKMEASALELSDISLTAGTIHIRVSKSRPRVVPMSDRLCIAMSRWLRRRGTRPGCLWVPKRQSQDAYSFVRTVLDNRSKGTVTAHQLRRRFACQWLLAGGSEASLVRVMGWADATQVRTYVRAAQDEIALSEYRKIVG